MIIEKIRIEKNKIFIVINSVEYSDINPDVYSSYMLKEGMKLDKKQMNEILSESEKLNAKSYLYSYLMKRMKTEAECKKKLIEKGYSNIAVSYAVAKVKEYGYIDDREYAERFIEEKKSIWGEYRIAFELRRRGVDESLTEECLSGYSDSEQTCLAVAKKYLKNKTMDTKMKQKLYGYLSSRGFSYEDIKYSIDCISDN